MFIFLSCFSRFVGPCYYAPEKGKKVPRKNLLPLSPVQISLVTPSFDKISELGKRKILPANHPAFARSGAASANRRKLKANRISAHSRLPRRSLGEGWSFGVFGGQNLPTLRMHRASRVSV